MVADEQLCLTDDIHCLPCCIMHDYYSQEGSDKNNDKNEPHGFLDSDTECLRCGQPTIRRMGSKPSTTVADSVSDGHKEEAAERV